LKELKTEDILYLFYRFILNGYGSVVEKKRLEGFYKYLNKLGFKLPRMSTFLRRIRELASLGYFLYYIDRSKGIYFITDSVVNLVKPARQELLEKWYLSRKRRYYKARDRK